MVPLEKLELATLDIPDNNPQAQARIAELTRPGGVELQPAEKYEAQDRSGFVIVTVDREQMVTNVRIRPHWNDNLSPEAFPGALYSTYLTAVQRSLAVEAKRGPVSPPSAPRPATAPEDLTGLSPEEWLARMKSRLDTLDGEREAVVRRAQQTPRPVDQEFRSPLGYLTLRMRAGGPVAITADPHVLRNPSETVLSNEILQLFVQAGLGIAAQERPRPARPREGGEADDDYFSAVNVFDDRD
ncbi:hypothetical protein ACIA8G_11825 [Lentzea sp. NPDC051213]|uniref:hypothetical protein n=1 Tax=Lentzea sp. NPDC051213 TaxID=3364126 RepID=UPI0037A021D9